MNWKVEVSNNLEVRRNQLIISCKNYSILNRQGRIKRRFKINKMELERAQENTLARLVQGKTKNTQKQSKTSLILQLEKVQPSMISFLV